MRGVQAQQANVIRKIPEWLLSLKSCSLEKQTMNCPISGLQLEELTRTSIYKRVSANRLPQDSSGFDKGCGCWETAGELLRRIQKNQSEAKENKTTCPDGATIKYPSICHWSRVWDGWTSRVHLPLLWANSVGLTPHLTEPKDIIIARAH